MDSERFRLWEESPEGSSKRRKGNAVHTYGNSAAQQAQTLTMTSDPNHRAKERSSEETRSREKESPTLAGYIVYVTTVLGFVTMCVLSALR